MKEYNILNNVCYLLDDVHKDYKSYWTEKRRIKSIIKEGKIPNNKYWYYKHDKKTNKYEPCKEGYTQGFVFIEKQWCIDNIMQPKYRHINEDTTITVTTTSNTIQEEPELETRTYTNAPKKIKLTEYEHIILEDGTKMNIPVYGERQYDKCYIKVSDVTKLFNMHSVEKVVIDKRSSFKDGIDYVYFYDTDKTNSGDAVKVVRQNIKPYFTYHGFIHYCLSSLNSNAQMMSRWITKIICTHHIGTRENKGSLACNLLDISNRYSNVLYSFKVPISGIYLFHFAYIKDLRGKIPDEYINKYPDNAMLCKYGQSSNISDRFENIRQTHSEFITNKQLLCVAQTDITKLVEAENDLRNMFKNIKCVFEHPEHREMVILMPEQLELVNTKYTEIGQKHEHSYSKYESNIEQYKKNIEFKNKELEYKDKELEYKDTIISCKDKELEYKDTIISCKDNEIELLRREIEYLSKNQK